MNRSNFQTGDQNVQNRVPQAKVNIEFIHYVIRDLSSLTFDTVPFFLLKRDEILSEFCARSTIHGVKHLVEQSRHWIDR